MIAIKNSQFQAIAAVPLLFLHSSTYFFIKATVIPNLMTYNSFFYPSYTLMKTSSKSYLIRPSFFQATLFRLNINAKILFHWPIPDVLFLGSNRFDHIALLFLSSTFQPLGSNNFRCFQKLSFCIIMLCSSLTHNVTFSFILKQRRNYLVSLVRFNLKSLKTKRVYTCTLKHHQMQIQNYQYL